MVRFIFALQYSSSSEKRSSEKDQCPQVHRWRRNEQYFERCESDKTCCHLDITDAYLSFESQLRKKQDEEKKLKDMLKKQGFNTDGMNFGGGMDPDMMEKVMRNIKKDKPAE